MELSFIHSPMLWGLALASIPIIIHLLFRRRFLRIDWAPMHYLKLSIQKNRRRIRIEQLLLLALRTFLVLLLFFLVARPEMQMKGLAKWLGERGATSQFVLLDDTLSMGYKHDGRAAFERATELAAQVIGSLGPADRLTLILASRQDQPLYDEAEIPEPNDLRLELAKLRPTAIHAPWKTTFESLAKRVSSAEFPIRELTVITDLRKSGWDESLDEIGAEWASDRTRMRIFNVGSEREDNLALTEFKPLERLSLVGTTMPWEATVRNGTTRLMDSVDASFVVDDKPSVVRIPAIEPGQSVRVPLTTTFATPGPHSVGFQLPDDELPGDNQRWGVTRVQEQLRLQLVDGEPSGEPLESEIYFLSWSLALGAGDGGAFQILVATDADYGAASIGKPDLIALANLAQLTQTQADELRRLVEGGAGLMIFLGDQVDPANYNQLLFEGSKPLLPASLDTVVEGESSGLLLEDVEAGPLDAMKQLNPAVLERIKIKKHFAVRVAPNTPGVRVLARWNNPEGAPAVLERTVGRGRVLLWTITADKAWSDWPTEPSYVLATLEAAKAIARSDLGLVATTAGAPLRYAMNEGERVTRAEVEAPFQEEPQAPRVEANKELPKDAAGEYPSQLAFDDTRFSGLYRLSWELAPTGKGRDQVAVNPDAKESDLRRISEEDVQALFGSFKPDVITPVTEDDAVTSVFRREFWRPLAMWLLALLAIEAAFATWCGRQR